MQPGNDFALNGIPTVRRPGCIELGPTVGGYDRRDAQCSDGPLLALLMWLTRVLHVGCVPDVAVPVAPFPSKTLGTVCGNRQLSALEELATRLCRFKSTGW